MSWAIHWQVPFAGFDGGQYRANILEQGYSGSIVTLTGGAEPFVTQEDADDDAFTPLRGQTGYLRIVTDVSSLMEQIMPTTNTQKMVELRYGSGDVLMWRGFLQAQAFTQPWDNNLRQIEFPVKSVLAALEDVQMNKSMSAERGKLWPLLVAAMGALDVTPDNVVMATAESTIGTLMQHLVKYGLFFSAEQIDNEGTTTTEQINSSYYDILSSIATLHGLTFREKGATIYMMDYISTPLAAVGTVKTAIFSWANIAAGTYTATSTTEQTAVDMMTAINATKRGNNNVIGYLQGKKSVRVRIELDEGDSTLAALPSTTEDTSAVIQLEGNDGTLYGQPHNPRFNSIETYTFSSYANLSPSQKQDSTAAVCIQQSPFYRPSPSGTILYPIITGAFPVRWAFREAGDTSQVILENGLFMSFVNYSGVDVSLNLRQNYSLKSVYSEHQTNGYLNININISQFTSTDYVAAPGFTLHCFLKYGNKIWNGTSWQTYTDTLVEFTIPIVNGTISSNKPADLQVDSDEGHFIPLDGEMSGQIEFGILDFYTISGSASAALYTILSRLDIGYYYPSDITVSSRGSNNYYRSLLSSGFGQERTITTNIGTWNNNLPSVSFLYDAGMNYIQTMDYQNEGVAVTMRPELHLLSLMAGYYTTIRRTMQQICKIADIYDRLYSYGGKYFVAVDESHNWRDDKQRVKFIEVKNGS